MSFPLRCLKHHVSRFARVNCRLCSTRVDDPRNVVPKSPVSPVSVSRAEQGICNSDANQLSLRLNSLVEESRRFVWNLYNGKVDAAPSVADIQNKLQQLQDSLSKHQAVLYDFGEEPHNHIQQKLIQSLPPGVPVLDEITARACRVVQTYSHDFDCVRLRINLAEGFREFPEGAYSGVDLDRHFGIITDPMALNSEERVCITSFSTEPSPHHDSDQYLIDLFGVHPDSLGDTLDILAGYETTVPPPLEQYLEQLSCGDCTNEGLITSMLDNDSPDWLSSVTYCVSDGSRLGSKHTVIAEGSSQPESLDTENRGQRPTLDQLRRVQDHMVEQIPGALKQRHDYRVYRADLIFENNYAEKPYVTKGIGPYVVDVAKLRMWVHANYANVRMQVIKAAVEEADGSVIIQWRMSGLPQLNAFMFWKFLPGFYRKNMSSESEWFEGVSTFYLDGEGLIAKHRLDSMMTDHERLVQKLEKKESLRRRLAAWLRPRPKPLVGV